MSYRPSHMANTPKPLTAIDLVSMRYALGDVVADEDERCLMMAASACPMRFDPAPGTGYGASRLCPIRDTPDWRS